MGQCQSENKQSSLTIFAISLQCIQSDYPIQAGLFSYPHRNFSILCNNFPDIAAISALEEKQYLLEFTADFQEDVSIMLKIYPYLGRQLKLECKDIQIDAVFADELNISKILYSINQNEMKSSLFIRNFYEFNEGYLNIAYEINTYNVISKIQSKYLHKVDRHFCVLAQKEIIDFHSHVVILQPVISNLSSMIKQRRKMKKMWNFWEFQQLFMDLVEGLCALHQNGFNHNDIRPSNIYYSQQKDCFLLGSFSNVTRSTRDKFTKNIKESNHYKDLYSTRRISRLSSLHINAIDLTKSDVYSLGLTLLSAFYLCQPIDRKKCAPYNRSLIQTYPHLTIIKEMICKIDQRKTIFQIRTLLQNITTQSMLKIPKNMQLYIATSSNKRKRQSYIAQGYKCLGMIGKWKDKLKQIFMSKENIQNSQENAKKFEQLAITSKIQRRREKSMDEYAQAAQIYTSLGEMNFIQGCFSRAIDFYKRGLANYEKVDDKQTQESYIKLLVRLMQCQITSGHELIPQQELTEVQNLIERIKPSDPKLYLQYTQSIYNIYDYYQDYGKIRDILARRSASIQTIKTKINILILKRRIIRNNLKLVTTATHPPTRNKILEETLYIIHEVFENYQYYLLQHPLQKFKMQFLRDKTQFLLKPSLTNLSKIITLSLRFDQKLLLPDKDRQIQIQFQFTQFYIQLFTQIGDIHYLTFKNYTQSLSNYSKAFSRAKDFFGDIYNKHCACLLQRIGKVNKSIDRFMTYLQCLDVVGKIYNSIYGQYHKDVARLSRKQLKDEMEETINQSVMTNSYANTNQDEAFSFAISQN